MALAQVGSPPGEQPTIYTAESDVNNDKNFAARGEFTWNGQFTVAPSYYTGKSNDTGLARENIDTYAASATWNWKNETVEAEYIHSEVGSIKSAGWQAWAGHSFKTGWRFLPEVQMLARYATVDPDLDVDDDANDCITVGTNLFIDGKYTKLQLNYEINGEETNSVDNNELLLNLQVAF